MTTEAELLAQRARSSTVDVCLRPLERRDLATIRNWLLREELRDLIGTVRPPAEIEHERWYERMTTDRTQYVAVIVDGDGVAYGACGLRAIDSVYGSADLWIYLGEERGRGIGAAALGQLLRAAFETLRLHRVGVQVFAYNQRSLEFFSACGFTREGVAREAVFKRGNYHDVIILSMLAREFSSSDR